MTTQLARKFSELLVAELGAETIAEINKRNEAYADKGCHSICASHEFCDPNVTMDEAFKAVLGEGVDCQCEDDSNLFFQAWTIAKEAKFNAEAILKTFGGWIESPVSHPMEGQSNPG